MGQLLVRNLDDSLKVRLQRRAKSHGHSMEQEVRDILCNALLREPAPTGGLGTEIAALFKDVHLEEPIPEMRGFRTFPATFDDE